MKGLALVYIDKTYDPLNVTVRRALDRRSKNLSFDPGPSTPYDFGQITQILYKAGTVIPVCLIGFLQGSNDIMHVTCI